MTLGYLLYLDLILLTRLVYLRQDGPMPVGANASLALIQLISVIGLFEWTAGVLAAALVISFVGLVNVIAESNALINRGFRVFTLAVLILIPGLLDGADGAFTLRAWAITIADFLAEHVPLLAAFDVSQPRDMLIIGFGVLMLANEANLAIRAVFHACQLEPGQRATAGDAPGATDRREYNAGRVIGILERWLMFIVVLQSTDLSALAFIIAAKGLARMKQLEDRNFAEYMLVGTLLSALAAVIAGRGITAMLAAV